MVSDPFLGSWLAFIEKSPGGLPAVLKDVDEVDHDRHGDAAALGLAVAASIWVLFPSMRTARWRSSRRVAAPSLAEGGGDDSGDGQ